MKLDILDILGYIFAVCLIVGFGVIIFTIIPDAYGEYKSYNIMKDECDINPDICFCDNGGCAIKSSCSYVKNNNDPISGGCNYTKICDIVNKANWKEGIWQYDCQ